MWATLMPTVALLIRPTYSSMIFGLFPADSMRVGCGIRVGMMIRHRNNPQARGTSKRRIKSFGGATGVLTLLWRPQGRAGTPGSPLAASERHGVRASPRSILGFYEGAKRPAGEHHLNLMKISL